MKRTPREYFSIKYTRIALIRPTLDENQKFGPLFETDNAQETDILTNTGQLWPTLRCGQSTGLNSGDNYFLPRVCAKTPVLQVLLVFPHTLEAGIELSGSSVVLFLCTANLLLVTVLKTENPCKMEYLK